MTSVVVTASLVREPRQSNEGGTSRFAGWSGRADIVDRSGRILATNMATFSLYAHPQNMVDPDRAAEALGEIFPDMDVGKLKRDFSGGRRFLWLKRQVSPEQHQAVFDIGEPGLLFGPRFMRLYPNGAFASHVLGGVRFGAEGVASAEIVGIAGVERFFDGWLSDPANAGQALVLSLDLSVQAAVEQILAAGISMMNAVGGAAVLMNVRTGEVLALVSMPDFDPNDRPPPQTQGLAGESPLFNRAVQGLYEFGSTFKVFPVAAALQRGLITEDSVFDTKEPYYIGRYRIREISRIPDQLTVAEILKRSSNIGAVKVGLELGGENLGAFLSQLGVLSRSPIQLSEAFSVQPAVPPKWPDITVATVSYGYGVTTSPLNLAAAYASLVNGGLRVTPTIIRDSDAVAGPRIISEPVSQSVRTMLRSVVSEGTASFARIESYAIGGKTGTAEKVSAAGGYDSDRTINTFASFFPAEDPQYVLVTVLDEAVETSGTSPRRTAGWTAVPVAAAIVSRVGPLLGIRPTLATPDTEARNAMRQE